MNEWLKFLNDTKETHTAFYDKINKFAVKYQGMDQIPGKAVRRLLLSLLDEIDEMCDSGKEICKYFEKLESGYTWEMDIYSLNPDFEKN